MYQLTKANITAMTVPMILPMKPNNYTKNISMIPKPLNLAEETH